MATTRNGLLAEIVTALGGTPTAVTRNGLLEQIVTALGEAPTAATRNGLLEQIVTALGGTPTATTRNGLLEQIVTALGGTPTAVTRNGLLEQIVTELYAVVLRYFAQLDPAAQMHYTLATPIVFTGDFEIAISALYSVAPSTAVPMMGGTAENSYVRFDDVSTLKIGMPEGNVVIGLSTPLDYSKLTDLTLSRVGSAYSLSNGVEVIGSNTGVVGVLTISYLARKGASNYFEGILANPKFTDLSGAEHVTTTFVLGNATSDTEVSAEGNNTLTYINIPESSREQFTLVDGDWIGEVNLWLESTRYAVATGWVDNADGTYDAVSEPHSTQTAFRVDVSAAAGSKALCGFSATSISQGSARMSYADYPTASLSSVGVISEIVTTINAGVNMKLHSSTDFLGSIENISVKRILEIA